MRYDYELDTSGKMLRQNSKTEKYSRVSGLFANDDTAIRAARTDLERLRNLAKGREVTGRFSGSGDWCEL